MLVDKVELELPLRNDCLKPDKTESKPHEKWDSKLDGKGQFRN